MALKNLRTTTSMLTTTSLLKGWMFSIVHISIQMIPPLKIKWMVWPMPKSPLWTFDRSWPILGMISHPWLKLGFDTPLSIQFSLGLVSSLLRTTNAQESPFLNLWTHFLPDWNIAYFPRTFATQTPNVLHALLWTWNTPRYHICRW